MKRLGIRVLHRVLVLTGCRCPKGGGHRWRQLNRYKKYDSAAVVKCKDCDKPYH